jgi:putative DNA primase/helicase
MTGGPSPDGTPPVTLPYPTDPSQVPAELAERPQWVVWYWKPTGRPDRPWTKPPVDPKTGRPAKADDPATWGTFRQAVAWAQRHHLAGIGLVLTEELRITGVDLDGCRDPETGAIADWAQAVVDRLDTFTQISPSRTGLRLFVKGRLPAWLLDRDRQGRRRGPIEVYQGGHYLTLTTERVPGTPDRIEARPDELEAWLAEVFPREPESGGPAVPAPPAGPAAPVPLDDAALLEAMFAARNGAAVRRLWEGDVGGHRHDRSAADQALCNHLAFWTDRDAARMDRLFRRSGLMRAKWERADYRERTIAKAIAGCPEGFRGQANPLDLGGVAERRNGHAGAKVLAPPSEGGPAPGVNRSDRGNAIRLVRAHGADLRYCYEFGRWYCWQGTHFAWDVTGEVERRAKDTVTRMLREAASLSDPVERHELSKHALRSESAAGVRAMLISAQSEAGVAVRAEQLDADRELFNTAVGTLETATGAMREHRRQDLLSKVAPVRYDPAAACPAWDAFLARILPDEPVRAFVRRAAGYSLTGLTGERVLFVLFGAGRNGKSTLLETLREVFGDYATVAPAELLLVKRHEGIPNDLARLRGARFVTAAETDEGRRLAEGVVKQVTGGDTITARFLHAEFFDFKPQLKLWLSTNHKPVIRGTDAGIWDRIRLIPFTVRIPDGEVDPGLPATLRAEAPGIFNWLLGGLAEWRERGLAPPEPVLAATDGYRQEMDVLGAFLDEACLEGPQLRATAKALYGAYSAWCERTGEQPENQRTFGMRLAERGFTRRKWGSGWSWYGIGLRVGDETEAGK